MSDKIFPMLKNLFSESESMILDFNKINSNLPEYKNIKSFFENCYIKGIDPKLPENRQTFNNNFLEHSSKRYLVGAYLEDRIEMLKDSVICNEGRTIHLGIDIFSKELENIFAPCNVEVITAAREEGFHGFGNYIILKPDSEFIKEHIFIGHLSKDLPKLGQYKTGDVIAKMGDYINEENGGWSRHIHVQLLSKPSEINIAQLGYSTKENLMKNQVLYPDPTFLCISNN